MKNMGRGLLLALALVGFVSANAQADCTKVKPSLAKHADKFTEQLEKFDEILHTVKADEKVIKVVHHFEEGMLEFVDELKKGATCKVLVDEFQHFHEDIQLLYKELKAQPALFYQDSVLNSWNKLLPAFVRFQNHLYWGRN